LNGKWFKDYDYEVEVDGVKHDVSRSVIMTMSTSYHGGNGYIYPFSAVNDGLLEVLWLVNPGFNIKDFRAADQRKADGCQSGY